MTGYSLEFLKRESYLLRKLQIDAAGVTTVDSRRNAIRAAITTKGLPEVICGKNSAGKPITFRHAYELTYGQAFNPTGKDQAA